MRLIAIDWSGAVIGAERHIWLAEVAEGEVVRLESGRSREQMAAHLVQEIARDPAMFIGLDFAFSFPRWFVEQQGCASAPELWPIVAREGERWLRDCQPPFWGRPGITRPDLHEHFRATDRAIAPVQGIRPKSVFQVGGAGAVGTGSIRGMPMLLQLREAGCAIWPFDPATLPVAVEIYPRAMTGAVAKRNPEARSAYLDARYPDLGEGIRAAAESSEDAFDALVSALVLASIVPATGGLPLPPVTDPNARHEGAIWAPVRPATPPD